MHTLKTDPDAFDALFDNKKTFEIRFNDRDFKVGDRLRLRRTESTGEQMALYNYPLRYTGSEIECRISHILYGDYGLLKGWCCLSIKDLICTNADGNDRS